MLKLFSCLAVISGTLLCAQDNAAYRRMLESKQQVTAYLVKKADEITARATAELATAGGWGKARPKRLEEMRDMLGLLPWPARTQRVRLRSFSAGRPQKRATATFPIRRRGPGSKTRSRACAA